MVFSSELLEHLSDEIFKKPYKNSKEYRKNISLLLYPNRENPDKLLIRCPQCKYISIRPITSDLLKVRISQFFSPEYKKTTEFTFGKPVMILSPALLKLKRK
jgi:hypothetical protein